MSWEHGGRVPDMRASVLDAECLGEHSPSLQAGNTQQLVYPNIEDCTHQDGPYCYSADERMHQRNDIILPESEDEN
jgi:hypothetical protein